MDQALKGSGRFPNNTPFIRKKASKSVETVLCLYCLLVNFSRKYVFKGTFGIPKWDSLQLLRGSKCCPRQRNGSAEKPIIAVVRGVSFIGFRQPKTQEILQSFSWMIYDDSWNQNNGCETLNGCVSKISDHSTCSWKHWIVRKGFCVKFWGIWAYPKLSRIHHVIKIFFNFQQSRCITGKGCKF